MRKKRKWFVGTRTTAENPSAFEAHHVVPCEILENNVEFQKLMKWAYDNNIDFGFHKIENGMMIQKKSIKYDQNGHTSHDAYTKALDAKINAIITKPSNVGKPDKALKEIQDLINIAKIKLKDEVLLGTKDVNDIINF